MNISTSECSSDCESGWTMYLDQTSNSTDRYTTDSAKNFAADSYPYQVDQEDDEDLSMVSDASSGPPPHFQDYENYAAAGSGENPFFRGYPSSVSEDTNKKKSMQQRSKTKDTREYRRQQNFCLADTATSPVFHFPQDNVAPSGFSQVFSAANFESESIPKKQLPGFLKSSTQGKSASFLGRKRQ